MLELRGHLRKGDRMKYRLCLFPAVRVLVCFWVLTFLNSATVGAQLAHEFIGASKCAICHKKPEQGEQYRIWQESKHAKAFETLGTSQAKEFASKLGIDDPQKSGKCLKCHSTAYGFSEARVTEAITVEEGISCESCHGAGKDYMKKSIMQDRDEAITKGLLIPDEKTCLKCHNQESPTFKAFDFNERWEKIKHPVPA